MRRLLFYSYFGKLKEIKVQYSTHSSLFYYAQTVPFIENIRLGYYFLCTSWRKRLQVQAQRIEHSNILAFILKCSYTLDLVNDTREINFLQSVNHLYRTGKAQWTGYIPNTTTNNSTYWGVKGKPLWGT